MIDSTPFPWHRHSVLVGIVLIVAGANVKVRSDEPAALQPNTAAAIVIPPIPDPPMEGTVVLKLMAAVRRMDDIVAKAGTAGHPAASDLKALSRDLDKLKVPGPEAPAYQGCLDAATEIRTSASEGRAINVAAVNANIKALRAALHMKPDDTADEPLLIAYRVVSQIIPFPANADAAGRLRISEQLLSDPELDPEKVRLLQDFVASLRRLTKTPTRELKIEAAKKARKLAIVLQMDGYRTLQLWRKYGRKYRL